MLLRWAAATSARNPVLGVKLTRGLPIRGRVNENVRNLHTLVTHEGERVPLKTHRQSIGERPAPPFAFQISRKIRPMQLYRPR